MELTDTDLSKFQALYRGYFNIELDRDTAYRKLSALVRQMELVYQPITQAQLDAFTNENEYQREQSKSKN
jgi:hypothetical protein